MNTETPAESESVVTPPDVVTLTPKDVQVVTTLRAAVWQAVQGLPPGHPTRGQLAEALFIFQVNAPAELKP